MKKVYLFCAAYTMEQIPMRHDFKIRAIIDTQKNALDFTMLDPSVTVQDQSNWEIVEDAKGEYRRKRIGRNNSIFGRGFWMGVFAVEMGTFIICLDEPNGL